MCMGSSPSAPDADKDWRAEDDHRTLTRAAEVRADPSRMAGVSKHHQKMQKNLASVGRSLGGKRRSA